MLSLEPGTPRNRIARTIYTAALVAAAGLVFAPAARAQDACDGQWLPTIGPSGVDGSVYAMAKWDPDGPGPLPEGVLMGGSFAVAGNVAANNIAWWNPQTGEFMAFGSGVNGTVTAIVVGPDGNPVVGGDFSMAGGLAARHIAAWADGRWAAFGNGIDNLPNGHEPTIQSMVVFGGALVVSGSFHSASGVVTGGIATWNGQAWSPLGSAPFTSDVGGLMGVDPVSGSLYRSALGALARWDGAAWQISSTTYDYEGPFSFDTAGTAYVAGASPFPSILRWSQSTGSVFASFSNGGVSALLAADFGHCSAANNGYTQAGYSTPPGMRIDLPSGVVNYKCSALARCFASLMTDSLLVGGDFAGVGYYLEPLVYGSDFAFTAQTGQPAKFANGEIQPLSGMGGPFRPDFVTRLSDGTTAAINEDHSRVYLLDSANHWANLPFDRDPYFISQSGSQSSSVRYVSAIAPMNDGGLAAMQAERIYYRSSTAGWTFIGDIGGYPYRAGLRDARMLTLPNGDLIVAAAELAQMNGQTVHSIARWDGESWFDMCSSIQWSSLVHHLELATLPNGDLLVCGDIVAIDGVPVSSIARWDGTSWHAMGDLSLTGRVTLCSLPSGRLAASGLPSENPTSRTRLVREWTNGQWVTGVAVPDDHFYFTVNDSGHYYNKFVGGVACRDNGDIIVSGKFTSIDGVAANNIARWDGSAWHPIGAGLAGDYVSQLLTAPDGSVYAAGSFSHSGNVVSYGLAHAVFGAGSPPTITQQPENYATCFGYDAIFHVAAASSGALAYHWTLDGTPIDPALNPSALTDTLIIADGARPASYRCVVSNGCGSVTSDAVTPFEHPCCPDYNYDGVVDQGDIDAMILLMEDQSPVGKNPDFNQDGIFDQGDVDALITVIAGGPCP